MTLPRKESKLSVPMNDVADFDKAFVGVSLNSKLFTRLWIRSALDYILQRHENLMFLLADDLLLYTRSAIISEGVIVLDFDGASAFARTKRLEVERLLLSESNRLSLSQSCRIEIQPWNQFTDDLYVQLLRRLQIAFLTINSFTECVKEVADKHVRTYLAKANIPNPIETSIGFILDEVAMCLRVSELGGYYNEYYPAMDSNVLTKLYSNTFAEYGLSIDSLIGRRPQRKFTTLNSF
jgi:hypothetical protein